MCDDMMDLRRSNHEDSGSFAAEHSSRSNAGGENWRGSAVVLRTTAGDIASLLDIRGDIGFPPGSNCEGCPFLRQATETSFDNGASISTTCVTTSQNCHIGPPVPLLL